METNDHDVLKSDLSDDNKMKDSNLEDDTEDYIQPSQPSQPLSFQSSSLESINKKVSKNSDNVNMNMSTIEETLSFPKSAMLTQENSDFIQSSNNPTNPTGENFQPLSDDSSQNKFNLEDTNILKVTPDLFSTQSQMNDTVDVVHLKIPQTPSMPESQNVSTVPESPQQINETLESETSDVAFPESRKSQVLEETTTEDSLQEESVELSGLNNKNKTEVSETDENKSDDSNKGKDVTEDSSPRFIDSSGMSSLLHTENVEVVNGSNSESHEAVLDDTVDVEDMKFYCPQSSEKTDVEGVDVVPPVTEGITSQVDSDSEHTPLNESLGQKVSRLKSVLKNISEEELSRLQKHSTPENPLSHSLKINESTSSIENGTPQAEEDDVVKPSELNFTMYLQLNCQVLIDPLKSQPISKKILSVKELIKRQPKQIFLEPNSDSTFKSKRLSSSSSGSVYSDKAALPYILPGRSATSTTETSSNSSMDIAKQIKIANRQEWVNEYMISLALDEILPRYIEKSQRESTNSDSNTNSKRKVIVRVRKKSHWSHPLDNVLESSMTEPSSENNSDVQVPNKNESEASESKPSENAEISECKRTEDICKEEENVETKKEELEPKNIVQSPKKLEVNECADGVMTEGQLIFARWTDKRYYSGRLNSRAKYDRWEVEFDDNTSKVIREDLILPLKWLTEGELVFALVEDKYMSGKILDIIREGEEGEDVKFKIELDDNNEEVFIKKSDICLNDVMAGIIREKFKPTNRPNLPVKSDIDFDNVVAGKRVREQRTPIRTGSTLQPGSSTTKKRRGGVRSSEEMSTGMKTPKTKTPLRKRDLSSEKSEKKLVKLELHPENDDEHEDAETTSKTGKKTLLHSSGKPEGVKKRGRELKYDTEKCSSSSKKSKPSQSVTDSENSEPVARRGRKTSKALIAEFENESGNDVEMQDIDSLEDSKTQKQNRSSRTPKAKDENNRGRGTARSGKKNLSTGKRKTKKA